MIGQDIHDILWELSSGDAECFLSHAKEFGSGFDEFVGGRHAVIFNSAAFFREPRYNNSFP